jgi:hypothetical protein
LADQGAETPKVYDVRRVTLKIGGEVITGLAPDGFGISPTAETTLISGLKGEVGFNVDPSSGAEATVTLKSVSDSNEYLRQLLNKQREAMQSDSPFEPFKFEVIVDPGWDRAFGFKTKRIEYCVITKWPDFATDEKEAPDYEWGFMGYGYKEE